MRRIKQAFAHDLRWQLLSLYLLSVLLVFGAGLIFALTTNRQLTTETEFTDFALTHAIAQETASSIQHPYEAVQYLAKQEGVLQASPAQMMTLFQIVQETSVDYNLVYRLDGDGTMIFHYPAGVRSTVGDDFSFRPYFEKAQSTRSPFVSVGRTSPTTQRPVATIVMPLWEEESYLGIVAINIELQALSETLSDVAVQENSLGYLNITIIDSQGQILASLKPDLVLREIGEIFPHLSDASFPLPIDNLIEPDLHRQTYLFSSAPIAETGWSVVVSRPTTVAFATLNRFQRGFLLLMFLYLGFGVLSWLVLSKRLIVPLQHITSYIKNRELEAPVEPSEAHQLTKYAARSDQLGHLGKSVIETEQQIMARWHELTTLLETSTAVTSSLDTKTVLNSILAEVEQILKIDMSAIIVYLESEQLCKVRAGRHLSSRYIQQFSVPGNMERLTMQALGGGQFIQITDLAQHEKPERVAPGALAEGARAIFAIPLKTTHAQPSVLVGYKTEPYSFSQREINLLSSFANHAAMALENATLYGMSDILLKEQTRRLEALIYSLGDGLVLEGLGGHIQYVNRWMSEFTGLPTEQIKQSSISQLLKHLHTQAITTKKRASQQEPEGGKLSAIKILALPHANRIRYLRASIFEVRDDQAKMIGRGLLLEDITKNYELDRMKSLLISTVSHELRTPLASIKGYASTLLADDVEWEPEEQQEFLSIIEREADRLNRLVKELLDISRLEAGQLNLSLVPCKLHNITSKAASLVHPPPNQRLQLKLPANLPSIIADPQRLEVVIRNLIQNSVKYAEPDTPITLSAEVKDGTVIVRVSDQGPGIAEPHRERIFDTFYRVEDGLTRQSGFGLGLAICQGFIQAQGGRIWLEEQTNGTTIAFSLPILEIRD